MSEFLAELSLQALVVAMAAGLVFGLALPTVLRWLVDPLIPELHMLLPVVVVALGAGFFAARGIDDALDGGSPGHAIGRFCVFVVYIVAVTIGSLLRQRLRPSPDVSYVRDHIAENKEKADASDRRRLAIIDSQTDAQRAAGKR